MRDEDISSGGNNNAVDPTPAASASLSLSSVGASFPALPENAGSGDCLGDGLGSKTGSLSGISAQPPQASLSTSAGDSALGSSQPSCRPWERGDLLRRLSTFNPDYWFGKPKAASSLTCACRGWMNVDIDKIECETCGASLKYTPTAAWLSAEADGSCDSREDFGKHLDLGHKGSCPWRGNTCPESLVQFPPTPPLALIGGYKERCDGLFQFAALPIVAASAVKQMRVSHGSQIDHLLTQTFNLLAGEPGIRAENITEVETISKEDASLYSRTQKLISLCGWEPRWFLDVQDFEEHSAQSARNGCSVCPSEDRICPRDPGSSNKALSITSMKYSDKNDGAGLESKCESRAPLLDCSLCGATVKIWDFITVPRPAHVSINDADFPETSKKMAVPRGVSAASGISGWAATDARYIEGSECHDGAATTDEGKHLSNTGVDLNLTMAGGLTPLQLNMPEVSPQCHDTDLGKDLMIGQPSNSESNRATSYESRGPVSRKRSSDERGSTIDRPVLGMQQADSAEATVIDRDGDEVNDGSQYLAGPSKRFCGSIFGGYGSSYKRETSGVSPSQSQGFEAESDALRFNISQHESDQFSHFRSNKDSISASSLMAMDAVCLSADDNSMDSVENVPGTDDDVSVQMTMFRNPGVNDNSEMNKSNQAQQSACFQHVAARADGEMGVSSTSDGDEVLNTETGTTHAMDGLSIGMTDGSVGMGASHEAEIHGTNMFINRSDSGAGDTGPVAEVVENQGQTGEFGSTTRTIDNVVDQELHREDPHGDSQDITSQSVGRADGGSKVFGSTKGDSAESGEKISNMQIIARDNSAHPSLSCNAVVYSGFEVSKEEVRQDDKRSPTTDFPYLELGYTAANGIGPPSGESNYEERVEFDPIRHHNSFCPWVNGNVAAAGCNSSSTSSAGTLALCGWQMTLDALNAFCSPGHIPVQPVESESAASMYKDDQLTAERKLMTHHSFSKSRGQK